MARAKRAGVPVPITPMHSQDRMSALLLTSMQELAGDPSAPAHARTAAARTLLEVRGLLGRHARAPDVTTSQPLAVLSRAQLEAELAATRQHIAAYNTNDT